METDMDDISAIEFIEINDNELIHNEDKFDMDANFISNKKIPVKKYATYHDISFYDSGESQPLLNNNSLNVTDSDDEMELCEEDISNIDNNSDIQNGESGNEQDESDNESEQADEIILLDNIDITDDEDNEDKPQANKQLCIINTYSTDVVKNVMSKAGKLRGNSLMRRHRKLPMSPTRLSPVNNLLPPMPNNRRPLFAFTKKHRFVKYNCPDCEAGFYTESSLNNHYFQTHIDNADRWKCNKCGALFDDGDDLDDHLENCDTIGDIIPTSDNGAFACPNCDNKYAMAALLGEHFTLSHNSYTENSLLDKPKNGGFPGFDILEMIGMIVFRDQTRMFNISELDYCPVCACKYSTYEPNITNANQNVSIKRSQSDTNLLNTNKHQHSMFSKEDHNIESIEISDSDLIDKINTRVEHMKPHFTLCCKKDICGFCIINIIKYQDNLKCFYCTKNHEPNGDYLKIMDGTGDCNDSWSNWWLQYKNILTNNINDNISITYV